MTKTEYNRIDYIEEVIANAIELLDSGRIAPAREIVRGVHLQLRVLKRIGEKRYGEITD
ncbi:TPA: hypothetical protein PXO92_002673 [Yersinia enterocolitica]|nr:hypothetical protein [Yersinia enterocolitica]